MNKFILSVFAVFLTGLIILLSKIGCWEKFSPPEPSPSLIAEQSDIIISSENVREPLDKVPHSVSGFGGFSDSASDSAKLLTNEEAAQVEEAFDLVAPMQVFLDDDDETNALKEARSLAIHSNPEVRMTALEAMRWIGPSATLDIPLFFGDNDEAIAQLAEEVFWDAIDEIGDPVLQIKMFEISLKSSSHQLRYDALERIIYLPDALSFPTMAPMLNDPNEDVRDLARENLEFISEEEFTSEAEAMDWFDINKTDLEEFWSL